MPQSMGAKSGSASSALLDWRNKPLMSLMLRASTRLSLCVVLRRTQGAVSQGAGSAQKRRVQSERSRIERCYALAPN